MADPELTSPLIPVQPSENPQLVLTIQEDSDPPLQTHYQNTNHSNTHLSFSNPYEGLGSSGFSVPETTTIDPFRNHTPNIDGIYEWLKIAICFPLAICRLVLFGICLLVGYLATKLALQGWKDKENPMPRWRCRIMWITRVCARCILLSFGFHWIKRKGKAAPRDVAPIVVSNHVSYIEPIFYFYELCPTMVAAESHDSMPFVGTIIRAMQVIYVNRFSSSSKKHAVSEIKRKASSNRFPRVLLFPEGTTTNGRVLISFQLGAFIPRYAIQPVIVRYPHVHFDQSWGHVSLAKLMFRMFTQFHNFMEVEYLPVVSPVDERKESAQRFAERTSHAMATALNVVQTYHSYGDVMLLVKASGSKHERPSAFMVEMARVEPLSRVSSLEAVDFLDTFLLMNPDPSGRVTYHDFIRVLGLKACTFSQEIFAFIDVEKTGTITFKQFLLGSVHVMSQPLFSRACESAFAECSAGEDDYISKQQLKDSIAPAMPDLKEDEVDKLFKLFDADSDGKVSKNDFFSCLRRNPLLIALFSHSLFLKRSLQDGNTMLQEIV